MRGLPDEMMSALSNVQIVLESEPPKSSEDDDVLGLYDGMSILDRGGSANGTLPDVITIYMGPLERACAGRSELEEEIQITLLHELAHHFGYDEAGIESLGLA